MERDRWFVASLIGALVACLACLTPIAVIALGAIGLGAWTGHLDIVLTAVLVIFLAIAAYRWREMRRRAS
jgi:mercuric ion transport protein